jgi:glycosyltransferase involved in cell wall biosynthesis
MPFFAPAFGTVVRLVKSRVKVTVLVICDNIIPHENRAFDRILTKYFFNAVDRFIVMSEAVKEDLLSLMPDPVVVHTPHPLYDIFGPSVNKTAARQRLRLQADKVILYFGYIRRYKGLDLLIEATSLLKNRLGDFIVLAVGESYENPQRYYELIEKEELGNWFDLRLEFVADNQVADYFCAADVVVLPYRSATQSGIVPIAYHFDRPVIVTNVGGLPEITPDGMTGLVVEPNPEAIAAGIVRFYKENLANRFQSNISSYKNRFTWENFTSQIEALVSN